MVIGSAVESENLVLKPLDLVRPFASSDGAAGLVITATRARGPRSATVEAGIHRIGTGSATMAE